MSRADFHTLNAPTAGTIDPSNGLFPPVGVFGFQNSTNNNLYCAAFDYQSSQAQMETAAVDADRSIVEQPQSPAPFGCLEVPNCSLTNPCPSRSPPVHCYGPILGTCVCFSCLFGSD